MTEVIYLAEKMIQLKDEELERIKNKVAQLEMILGEAIANLQEVIKISNRMVEDAEKQLEQLKENL